MLQALLLYAETTKARFLPSGEASGVPTEVLVVHSLETTPFDETCRIAASRADELVTNHPLPSADQLMPERRAERPELTARADPLSNSTNRIWSLCSSRSTMANVEPSGDRSHAGNPAGSAASLISSAILPRCGSKELNTSSPFALSGSLRMQGECPGAHRTDG